MIPNFSRRTVDTLAKRAGYLCSNPDCRARTVGPNSEPDKATTIGEAAHIQGARPGAERYNPEMTDVSRAEITNGIWLCRNCHRRVDRDPEEYPVSLLFAWRAGHEEHVARELGTASERLSYELKMAELSRFSDYPPLVKRIAADMPQAWKWRLTAELLRHLNAPFFKRLRDLRAGYVFVAQNRVSDDDVFGWLEDRIYVMGNVIPPLVGLLDRLTASWGNQDDSDSVEEIHDTCLLIRDSLAEIVRHEEQLRFAKLPDEAEELRELMTDAVGVAIEQLSDLPQTLEEFVSFASTDHGGTIEKPTVLQKSIIIELPNGWEEKMDQAIVRFQDSLLL